MFGVAGNPVGGTWSTTGCISVTAGGIAKINSTGAGSLTYTYTNANGCSNARTMTGFGYTCAAKGVSINGELGMENGKLADFALFPNPATSVVNLFVEKLVGEGSISVIDIYGKIVKRQQLSLGNNAIDILNLSKGFYLVNVTINNGIISKKLIVN